ncbi:MAG: M48 family metallopeptidase [Candidatus Saganbacteria bacterium]|nr:M48 family metallopeptidase [Candidatus Saganbacteria bacterium]
MIEIDELVRSKRRSLALIVTPEAKLVVRAPLRLPEDQIREFIRQKHGWIKNKLRQMADRPRARVLSSEETAELKASARRIIPERVKYYSQLTGLKPGSVKITSARRRWGSCSAKGSLNFSWRLVAMPLEVIDYVVVHELMHLVERNHGERFWRRVGEIIPDHQKQRRWLKERT